MFEYFTSKCIEIGFEFICYEKQVEGKIFDKIINKIKLQIE